MLNYKFAFCIKFIISNCETSSFKEMCTKVYSCILCNLVSITYKIICTFKFYKLVCILTYSINIKISICLNAMLNLWRVKHSTILVKYIFSCRQKIICTGNIIFASYCKITTIYVIIITIFFDKPCCNGNTIFKISCSIITNKDACKIRYILANKYAFFSKFINLTRIVTFNKHAYTLMTVTFSVKSICFSTNSYPNSICMRVARTATIVVCSVTKSGSIFSFYPSTFCNASFTKIICNPIYGSFSSCKLVVTICETIFSCFDSLPTSKKVTCDCIIMASVHFEYAGIYINCAAIFVGTNKFSVNNLIIVGYFKFFKNGTPLNYRLASFAVSSVFITCFSSGCFFIKNSKFYIVNVIRGRDGGKFGCNVDCASKRSIINSTINNFAIYVYNRFVAHFSRSIIGIGNIVVTVKSPNTNRNAYESAFSCFIGSVRFNCYSKKFGNFVVIKSCFKAVCNNRTFGFPSVGVIELKLCNNFVCVCKVCNIDIYIVDGLCLGSFLGIVMTGKFNNCITCNSKSSGKSCRVTEFIFNFKSYSMNTGIKNISLLGTNSARVTCCSRNFYAIDKDFSGFDIKSFVIANISKESYCTIFMNNTTINCCAILKFYSSIYLNTIFRIRDNRSNSVVNCRAVVKSDIVDIESDNISGIGFYISTDERRRTAVTFISCNRGAKIIIFRNIDSRINPSGFRNICIGCGVKVSRLSGCCRSEHKVILFAAIRAISILYIKLRLECKTFSCRGECVFGNIDPHTKCGCFLSICNVTKNNGFANVEKNVIGPACKGSIGVIKSPLKSIVTVSYLATIFFGNHVSSTAEIFVELACKRSGTNESVVNFVVLAPFFSFFKAHEACFIAIFKVPNNFGTFTEFDCIGKNNFAISNGYINTSDAFISSCGKVKSVKNSCSIVRKTYFNNVDIYINICFTGHCNDRKGNGADFFLSRIRNNGGSCRKFENFRFSNSNGFGTNYFTAGNNLNVNNACFSVRNEFAVFNRAKGSIGKSPAYICRHIHCITMSIDCCCTKGINSAGSKDIIIRFYVYVIKNSGRSNVGSNENTVCGRTLCTVARYRTHFKSFFTNTF